MAYHNCDWSQNKQSTEVGNRNAKKTHARINVLYKDKLLEDIPLTNSKSNLLIKGPLTSQLV